MQIFSKIRDIFKNRRGAEQATKKRKRHAKIGTCGHFHLNNKCSILARDLCYCKLKLKQEYSCFLIMCERLLINIKILTVNSSSKIMWCSSYSRVICCFDDVLSGLIPGPLVIFSLFLFRVSPSLSWLSQRITSEVAFRMNWIESQMERMKDTV